VTPELGGEDSPTEIAPSELVETTIPVAWRGYDSAFVDKLLERAAATIERLQQFDTPTLERERREAADLMQRTLMLARRTADEATAKAEMNAETLVKEAQTAATRIVSDAEQIASHLIESEQARAQATIGEALGVRDMIQKDIDVLERFASRLRGRLRSLLHEETEALDSVLSDVTRGRPEVHEIDITELAAGPSSDAVRQRTPGVDDSRPPEAVPPVAPGDDDQRSGITG
jgi:cell division septum initiation protein DivIVA